MERVPLILNNLETGVFAVKPFILVSCKVGTYFPTFLLMGEYFAFCSFLIWLLSFICVVLMTKFFQCSFVVQENIGDRFDGDLDGS